MNFPAQKSSFSINRQAPFALKKRAPSAGDARKQLGRESLWNGAHPLTFASLLAPLHRTNSSASPVAPDAVQRSIALPSLISKLDPRLPFVSFPASASGSPSEKPLTLAAPPQTAPAKPAADRVPTTPHAGAPDGMTKSFPNGGIRVAQEPRLLQTLFASATATETHQPIPQAAESEPRNDSGLQRFTRETPNPNLSPNSYTSAQTAFFQGSDSNRSFSEQRISPLQDVLTSEQRVSERVHPTPASFFASEFNHRIPDTVLLKVEILPAPLQIFGADRPLGFMQDADVRSYVEVPGALRLCAVSSSISEASSVQSAGAPPDAKGAEVKLEADTVGVRMPENAAVRAVSSAETPESPDVKPKSDPPKPAAMIPKYDAAARLNNPRTNVHFEPNQERTNLDPAEASVEEPDGTDAGGEDFTIPISGSSGNNTITGSSSVPPAESQTPTVVEGDENTVNDSASDDAPSEWISPEGAGGTGSRNGSAGGSGGSSASSSSAGFRSVPFAVKLNRTAKRPAPQKTPSRLQAAHSPRRPTGTLAAPRALKLKPVASADPTHRLEPMQIAHPAHRTKSTNADSSAGKIIRLQEVRELADKIQARARLLDGSKTRLEIKLNPAHLGRISVQLETEGDEMHLLFFAGQDETAQALKEAKPELVQLLNEQGYHLTRCDIETHLPSWNPPDPHHPAPSEGRAAKHERYAAEDETEKESSMQPNYRPLFLGYNTMDVIA